MKEKYLVTGGAGFIGSNYMYRLLGRGEQVTIYDNLSRPGADSNLKWLREKYGETSFELVRGDVRDFELLRQTARSADIIVHLAAQVAVTTSMTNPREDFEINALGTFNVVEAARLGGRRPMVLYASTNKVYGGMEEATVVEEETRYRYTDLPDGVAETWPLDFHSPYGCSKGTGDQYVRDYYRIYDIPTVVFRQSCIYGPRQFGVEDQGWVAWFIIAAHTGKPITIYGDGKQVRDLLYVEDLLDAYDLAIRNKEKAAGRVYNIGGGPANTMAVWTEFKNYLNPALHVSWADWRPGDQRVYVSGIRKAKDEFGWVPKVEVKEGITRLTDWVKRNF